MKIIEFIVSHTQQPESPSVCGRISSKFVKYLISQALRFHAAAIRLDEAAPQESATHLRLTLVVDPSVVPDEATARTCIEKFIGENWPDAKWQEKLDTIAPATTSR